MDYHHTLEAKSVKPVRDGGDRDFYFQSNIFVAESENCMDETFAILEGRNGSEISCIFRGCRPMAWS